MELSCEDDPVRDGRKPIVGEQRYTLTFPLAGGDPLKLYMGREGFNTFASFIAQMMIDDEREGAA